MICYFDSYEGKICNMSKNDKGTERGTRKKVKRVIGWVVGLGIVGGLLLVVVTAPRVSTGELESKAGLHYHPRLSIFVNGEKVAIPNNIGIGATHNPIHTHDEGDGTIHLEFDGVVKKDDIRLKKFFQVWDKEWTDTSFMGLPIGEGHTLTMTVNGTPLTEYGNYLMHDKDDIRLVYQ